MVKRSFLPNISSQTSVHPLSETYTAWCYPGLVYPTSISRFLTSYLSHSKSEFNSVLLTTPTWDIFRGGCTDKPVKVFLGAAMLRECLYNVEAHRSVPFFQSFFDIFYHSFSPFCLGGRLLPLVLPSVPRAFPYVFCGIIHVLASGARLVNLFSPLVPLDAPVWDLLK